jgi:hypothetical protein
MRTWRPVRVKDDMFRLAFYGPEAVSYARSIRGARDRRKTFLRVNLEDHPCRDRPNAPSTPWRGSSTAMGRSLGDCKPILPADHICRGRLPLHSGIAKRGPNLLDTIVLILDIAVVTYHVAKYLGLL